MTSSKDQTSSGLKGTISPWVLDPLELREKLMKEKKVLLSQQEVKRGKSNKGYFWHFLMTYLSHREEATFKNQEKRVSETALHGKRTPNTPEGNNSLGMNVARGARRPQFKSCCTTYDLGHDGHSMAKTFTYCSREGSTGD